MTVIKSHMKFYNHDVKVNGTLYQDGTSAITLTNPNTHEPIAKASANMGEVTQDALHSDAVFVKDYSENEGVLKTLIDGKIINPEPLAKLSNQYVTITAHRIIDSNVLKDIEEAKRRVNTESSARLGG
jgi:hypothetical protein